MTKRFLSSNDYVLLTMLPDPSKVPDMRRNRRISELFSTLHSHFNRRPDVLVGGNGYLCHDNTNPANWVKMDFVVAFGVIPDAIIGRNGYMIGEVGKPPDFVLEVVPEILNPASPNEFGLVADRFGEVRPDEIRLDYDYSRNRAGYAGYGVGEYWRLVIPSDEHQNRALAGLRLIDGEYQPIPLTDEPDGEIRGYSPALDLYLCWDGDLLRWFKQPRGRYLPNLSELADARDSAIKERDAEKALRVATEYQKFVVSERALVMEEMLRRRGAQPSPDDFFEERNNLVREMAEQRYAYATEQAFINGRIHQLDREPGC